MGSFFRIALALVLVAGVVVAMWWCIHTISLARYVPVADRTLSTAFAIGNAMPILVIPGLFIFLGVIQELRKVITEQKTQIADLKRELEATEGKD